MCVSRLVLLLGLLLCVGAELSNAQHWSHGWYPGGKRELDSFGTSEVGISVFVCVCQCAFTEHVLLRIKIFFTTLLFFHAQNISVSDFRGDEAV